MIALIPARAGSKRIPGKNTRALAGQPLLNYTLAAAKASGVFTRIVLASDDPMAFGVSEAGGGVKFFVRESVSDAQADILWIRPVLHEYRHEAFAILRPTSPFRTAATIRRAFAQFTRPDSTADSIRAVQPVKEHPGKMWTVRDGVLMPLLTGIRADGVPWHSCPTQSLPRIYVQNSSLEMGWTANVEVHGTIHGRKVAPFFTEGYEGYSLDDPADWATAERLIADGAVELPPVAVARLSSPPAA